MQENFFLYSQDIDLVPRKDPLALGWDYPLILSELIMQLYPSQPDLGLYTPLVYSTISKLQ